MLLSSRRSWLNVLSRSWFGARPARTFRPILKGWTFRPSLETLELRLTPSTFTVTTTADDGSSGSLRGAINAANAVGGAQTVTMGAGLFKLTKFATTETSTAGDLDVTCDLTLLGQNSATTFIDGGGVDRVFDIEAVLNVSFQNVTIQNALGQSGDSGGAVNATGGNLSFTNVILRNNSVTSDGGAINTTTGNITLTNCSLIGNHAKDEGGAINTSKGAITITNSTLQLNTAGTSGGAINMDSSTPTTTLSITNSSVNNNRAGHDGGAINDSSTGSITISKCVIINNVAGSAGGAIDADGSISIDSSNVGFNTSGSGGGAIEAEDSAKLLQITNSNLSADKAASDGGAVETDSSTVIYINDVMVSNRAGSFSGAIEEDSSGTTVSISGCTINNNTTVDSGGGVYSRGPMTIDNSVINFNAAGDDGGGVDDNAGSALKITNTTIFQNTSGDAGGGVASFSTTGIFTNDSIINNTAGSSGGGIYFSHTSGTLTATACTVSNNTARKEGGGLNTEVGVPGTTTIDGGNYNGNVSASSGGAMDIEGTATVINATVRNNTAASSGGGIYYSTGPSLTITSCTITNNVASNNSGGGILDVANTPTTFTLLGNFISGNTATEFGGGVCDYSNGTFTDISGGVAMGNTISQNISGGTGLSSGGGGIWTDSHKITFNASVISGNRAGNGGGMFIGLFSGDNGATSSVTLVNDTFAANTASVDGGAVFANNSGTGTGTHAHVTLVNDTLNLNAAAAGSGIFAAKTTAAAGSPTTTVSLGNTLVAGAPSGAATLFASSAGGTLTSLGHNLSTDKSGTFLTAAGDLTNITNPMLGPLQDNGGPTFTFALLPGSVAIDAGDDSLGGLTPSTDQRGVTRPQDGGSGRGPHVDIGAFEFVQLSKLIVTGPNSGSSPAVQVFNALKTGTPTQVSYSPITVAGFSNGARVALGDVNHDGVPDVILGSGPGQAPTVDVYDGKTGALLNTFPVLQTAFTGGIFVAEGTFGGKPGIVVGADAGGGSRVQVINANTGAILYDFLAFAPSFTGGVRVGVTDLNGDGQDDIICGAGGQVGSSAQVVVLDGTNPSHVLASLSPFGTSFTGGIYVAGGSFDSGSIYGDIVAGEGNLGSEVKVFAGNTLLQLQDFSAFPSTFTGGVRVGTLQDINGDPGNGSEIIVGQGPGGSNEVKVVEGSSPSTVIDDFFAYSTSVTNGVFVGGA
jgi:predicted outer membrane repeat protein